MTLPSFAVIWTIFPSPHLAQSFPVYFTYLMYVGKDWAQRQFGNFEHPNKNVLFFYENLTKAFYEHFLHLHATISDFLF